MIKHAVAIPGLAVLMFVAGLQTVSADPAVEQCRAQNNRIHSETLQLFQRARASGRITPAEAQQLAVMENRLRQIAQRLSFGGLTLGECRTITQQLVNERNIVARMAATPAGPGNDPVLVQCRQQNGQIHAETMQLFQRARVSGRITPAEQQQLVAMEQRLRQFAQRLSFGGLTLNECRTMTQALINERSAVARMAATPAGPGPGGPAVALCRQQNQQIHNETMRLFGQARASARITPAEQQQLAAMEQRLRQFAQQLSAGGLTLNECRAMTQALINERNVVARMAATPTGPGAGPALAQCRQQNGRIHAETMQFFQRAMAAGRITPQERQQLAAMEQRLRQFAQQLSAGGLTLNECRAMTQALTNERNIVARMAAR